MHCSSRLSVMVGVFGLFLALAATSVAQGRVGGVVKNADGQPVKGAKVVAKNRSITPVDFEITTDSQGKWAMLGLQNGTWNFTVTAEGYVPVDIRAPVVYLRPNAPITFTLVKGIPGIPVGVNMKELQGELEAAEALMANKQYDEAIVAYKALIAKAPALSMVNLQVGQAYRAKKDYDSAIATYESVLKVEPGSERFVIELGNTYMQKGDLDKAQATFEAAANLPSAGSEMFYNLGEVLFAKAQMDQAVAAYQKAADKDAAWTKPLFKIGLVSVNKGDKAGAIAMMEKVIALDPNSSEAAQARALIEELKK